MRLLVCATVLTAAIAAPSCDVGPSFSLDTDVVIEANCVPQAASYRSGVCTGAEYLTADPNAAADTPEAINRCNFKNCGAPTNDLPTCQATCAAINLSPKCADGKIENGTCTCVACLVESTLYQ